MTTPAISTSYSPTFHQRRLRSLTKRLVIELGYLEHCLAEGMQDTYLHSAATGIDTAIDCLNEYLAD
ncbi:MAG: hypothetical protein AAGD09_25245 [Cyanobacteria bacterium P01_F01_bin.56]